MNKSFGNMASRSLALLAALVLSFAPGISQAQSARSFSQQELDQMLAPIALYPDALLAQVLTAATYPMEVVEAARWASARPDLSGDEAVRAAEAEDWDASVKSLLAFPQVLARMRENLQWTQALGAAFLEQQSELMETVQALRRKAQAAGSLHSNERLSVVESGPSLLLHPSNPEVVYVPYYDPLVVFGSWWWPTYPPVYLRPWPGYFARPAYAGGFHWGPPIRISAGFYFGAIDWHRRGTGAIHIDRRHSDLTARRPAPLSPSIRMNRVHAWPRDTDRHRIPVYRGADAHRPDRHVDARPAALPEAHRETRYERRLPDASPRVAMRPNPWPVPFMPAVPVIRSPLAAQPAAQPAPATQPARAERGFDRRHELRGAAQPVQLPAATKPVPVMRAIPEVHSAPTWHRDRQEARIESGTRHDAPRALPPRIEARPAHKENTTIPVIRHETAVRPVVPQPSAARADVHRVQAGGRQEAGAKVIARH